MSRFEDCLKFVRRVEGGYSDGTGKNRADRGGATACGITQATYDEYRVRCGNGRQPVAGISDAEILDIYRTRYWAPVHGDNLPRPLDLVTFDAAVNNGVRQAIKFLQRALGVDDDGFIGKETLGAVASDLRIGMIPQVVSNMLDQRRDFYHALVARDPSQRVFLNGWLNRIDHLAKEASA